MRTFATHTYRTQNPVTNEVEETFHFIAVTDLAAAIAQVEP